MSAATAPRTASRPCRSTPARSRPRAPTPAPCRSTRPRPTPSTTPSTARGLFALQPSSATSTRRIMNPTTDVFEKRIAALEGGVGGARHRERPGGAVPRPHDARRGRRQRRLDRILYGGTYNQFKVTLPRLGIDVTLRRPATTPRLRAAHRRPHQGALRRDDRQPALQRPRPRRRSPRSRTSTGSRWSSTTPSAAPATCAGRSSTAPTSSSPRPPSGSAATAPRSAASSSTPAASTGASGASRSSPSRRRATTGCASRRSSAGLRRSATSPSPSGPGSRGCATSAPCLSPFNAFLLLQGLETLSLRVRAPRRQRPGAGALARGAPAGGVGELPGPRRRTRATSGRRKYLRHGFGARAHLRHPGRARGRAALHRRGRAGQPPRQRRRRQDPRHPPGLAPPTSSSRATSSGPPASRPTSIRVSVGIEHLEDIKADFDQAFARSAARLVGMSAAAISPAQQLRTLRSTNRSSSSRGRAARCRGRLPHLGRSRRGGDNAVLVCHALTGSADVDLWWPALLGPGRASTRSRDFVVCTQRARQLLRHHRAGEPRPGDGAPWGPRLPGHHHPRHGAAPGPPARRLGVRRLRLVIGGSLGGMQALEWAALRAGPGRLGRRRRRLGAPLRLVHRLERGAAAGPLRRPEVERRRLRPGRPAGGRARGGAGHRHVHLPEPRELRRPLRAARGPTGFEVER